MLGRNEFGIVEVVVIIMLVTVGVERFATREIGIFRASAVLEIVKIIDILNLVPLVRRVEGEIGRLVDRLFINRAARPIAFGVIVIIIRHGILHEKIAIYSMLTWVII